MGCDIHSYAERKRRGKWELIPDLHPFQWRNYTTFGFLAGVRSWIDPIDDPRGLPKDVSDEVREAYMKGRLIHTPSFLTIKELLEFDYDKPVFDGSTETYQDSLSSNFFTQLHELSLLKNPEDVRIVFWFDN